WLDPGILPRLSRAADNRARPAVVALVVAGAVLCGALTATIARAAVRGGPATLSITETFSTRSGAPSEGFVPFLAVERASDHASLLDAPFPKLERPGSRGQVRLRMGPGLLVIHRYMRICD